MLGFIQGVFNTVSTVGGFMLAFVMGFLLNFPFRGFGALKETMGWFSYVYVGYLIAMWAMYWLVMSKPKKVDELWKKADKKTDKVWDWFVMPKNSWAKGLFGGKKGKLWRIVQFSFLSLYYLFPLTIAFVTALITPGKSCFSVFSNMNYIWPSIYFFGLMIAISKLQITRIVLQISVANFLTSPFIASIWFDPKTEYVTFQIARAVIAIFGLVFYLVWRQTLRTQEEKDADAAIIAEKGFVLGYLYLFFQDQIEFLFPPDRNQKCKACGNKKGNHKHRRNCIHCGAPLPRAPWTCPVCKEVHEWNVLFCPNEGTPKPEVVSSITPLTRCPECHKMTMGERYCTYDGYDKQTEQLPKLNATEEETPPDDTPPKSLKEATIEAIDASDLSDKLKSALKM